MWSILPAARIRYRRRPGILALAILIAGSVLPATTATTAAGTVASTLQCTQDASFYTVRTDGSIWLHQHGEPESGTNSWSSAQSIGTGFSGRHVAAPGGVVYTATSAGLGQLRRRQSAGAQYEVIDSNLLWAVYTGTTFRNRITVDAFGDIYTVELDGWLHWRRYDPATRTLTHRLVVPGWSAYDLIVAAGPGVIYAREPAGALWRFAYHGDSQRYSGAVLFAGDGWNAYSDIVSPGGDLLYAVARGADTLWWYRYDEDTNTWALDRGTLTATGWPVDAQTLAHPDACQRVGHPLPTRPLIDPQPSAPVTLMLSTNGHLHYAYLDEDGRAVYGEAADVTGGSSLGLALVPGVVGATGVASMAENQDGRIKLVARGLDAEVRINTKASMTGPWGTATTMGGFVKSAASLVRAGDGTINAYALDRSGQLRNRAQLEPNGPFQAWVAQFAMPERWNGGPELRPETLTVLPNPRSTSNGVRLFALGDDGSFHTLAMPPGGMPTASQWSSIGGTGLRAPLSALVQSDNTMRLFATGSDGTVYTQSQTATGFPATWTAVPGVTASGSVSATKAPDGMIKLVVRATDGFVYYTSETGAGTFSPWQEITNFTEESSADPTALAVPNSNTWVVAYRSDLDVPRLRRARPAALTASTESFVEVPVIPPAG